MSIDLTFQGHFAVLTLNRPEALNALNAFMIESLAERIEEIARSEAQALIVVGAGDKAFCAGADVAELLGKDRNQQLAKSRQGQHVFALLESLPIPTLAVINGAAFGGGLELAMACTFRIATERARMGLPEIKLGLLPGYGGTQRLPRLVGLARALELVATGRAIDAHEAERIGLVNRVVFGSDAIIAGLDYFSGFGERFPSSMMMAITATRNATSFSLADGLEQEAELFSKVTQTSDASEGIRAFLEKRKPSFSGKNLG